MVGVAVRKGSLLVAIDTVRVPAASSSEEARHHLVSGPQVDTAASAGGGAPGALNAMEQLGEVALTQWLRWLQLPAGIETTVQVGAMDVVIEVLW